MGRGGAAGGGGALQSGLRGSGPHSRRVRHGRSVEARRSFALLLGQVEGAGL